MHPVVANAWELTLTAYFIVKWLIRAWALFVVPVNRKPTSALGWLMVIMLFPVFGLILFSLIGSPKLPLKRRTEQRLMDNLVRDAVRNAAKEPRLKPLLLPEIPEVYQPFETLAENLGGLPAFAGNEVELMPEYGAVFKRLKTDVDAAERFVHLEFYIICWDTLTNPLFLALAKAVQRGVKVRILFDPVGSRKYPGYDLLVKRLEALGMQVHPMLPVHLRRKDFTRPDLRNHRKVGVIDGKIAYTGSLNLITRNYHRRDDIIYDELVVRATGPVVAQFEAIFLTDWHAETGRILSVKNDPEVQIDLTRTGKSLLQVLPSGPGSETENNLKLFVALIHAARRQITIVNPYFVPDESLMVAITSAANRGVRVRMINSAVSDQFLVSHSQRSYYDQLLAAGVEIYLYRRPILLHSKTITIDEATAVIGSSNFDMRSFTLNMEVTLLAYDPAIVRQLHQIENQYLARTDRVEPEAWARRKRLARLLDNLARLTSAVQ